MIVTVPTEAVFEPAVFVKPSVFVCCVAAVKQ